MKNTFTIELRRFPVRVQSASGEITEDHIIITKQELHAAQLVGQSSKELITRIYKRNGYKVLDIGTAEKRTVDANLCDLWGGGLGG